MPKEQMKTQQSLHSREKIGAWSYDVINDKTYWSEDMYTILGLLPENGLPSIEEQKKIFFPHDYETLENDFQQTLLQGTHYLHELHIVYPDRSVHIIINQGQGVKDDTGKVIWLFGTTKDITEKKRIELALKESESMLDYVEERSGVGSFVWNFKTDNLSYSRNMLEMIGLTASSIPYSLRETIASLIHPHDKNKIKEEIAKMIACKKTWPISFRVCCPDGKERVLESHAKFVFDDLENPIKCIGVHHDITEKLEAQENIQILGDLVESFPASITVHDLAGKFLYANQKALELHGYTKEEFFSKNLSEIDTPDSQKWISERMALLQEKKELSFEVMHLHKDATLIPLEVHAKLSQWKQKDVILSIALDITERKKNQAAIEDQIFFQQSLMNAMPMPMFYKNLDCQYLGCNKAFENFFGLSREQILGKTVKDIAPENFVHIYQSHDDHVFHSQKFDVLESQAKAHDGTLRNVLFYKAPFFNRKGNIEGLIGVIMDITEHKQLEERLNQTEKMQALGQFAGGIAHDFNNQLLCIMGHAEMISLRSKDENIQNHAASILKSAESSAELTRKLLSFARKEKLSMTFVNVHSVIDDVIMLLTHSIDKRILIKKNFQAHPSFVMGNASQMQNAFMNLALNARDAMLQGGELAFFTESIQINKNNYPELVPGPYIQIAIKDTGIGMDAEILKHIFEPFFTTKDKGKGTGMGLTCAYSMTINHHGYIHVQSTLNKGTTFFICLPLAENIEKYGHTTKQEKVESPSLAAKILVVDDEEAICNLASEILNSLDYQVVTHKNALEAIKYYEEYYKEIDLVILDMVMPILNGKDTFIRMKKIHPQIRAILSSGFSLNAEAQDILDLGMISFLEKPYRIQELAQKIEDAIKR